MDLPWYFLPTKRLYPMIHLNLRLFWTLSLFDLLKMKRSNLNIQIEKSRSPEKITMDWQVSHILAILIQLRYKVIFFWLGLNCRIPVLLIATAIPIMKWKAKNHQIYLVYLVTEVSIFMEQFVRLYRGELFLYTRFNKGFYPFKILLHQSSVLILTFSF